jgi:hypothetical protein
MSAIDAIRQRCDQSARELRKALLAYREGNASVPYAVEAVPALYGDLLRHYLQWAVGLPAAMQDAAALRPAAQPAVDHLVTRAIAYFADAPRWPAVASLELPARLLIPAYYTVRAAQHVNALFRPPLLSLELAEPHQFAIVLLGPKASDQVCAHKNADLAPLTRVPEDEPPEKPLHYRAFLHASNRERLAEARAARPKPPAAPPPSIVATPAPAWGAVPQHSIPPPSLPPIGEEQRASWERELAGTSIVLGRKNSPPDYTGSVYWSTQSFLHLLPNRRFRKEVIGSSRVTYARVNSETPIHRETSGTWEVRAAGSRLYLVLDGGGSDMESFRLEKGPGGTLNVDGQLRAWTRR